MQGIIFQCLDDTKQTYHKEWQEEVIVKMPCPHVSSDFAWTSQIHLVSELTYRISSTLGSMQLFSAANAN